MPGDQIVSLAARTAFRGQVYPLSSVGVTLTTAPNPGPPSRIPEGAGEGAEHPLVTHDHDLDPERKRAAAGSQLHWDPAAALSR